MDEGQQREIKEVICSATGRRLLSCMLLVQPITSKELKQFVKLCFELFKSCASFKERSFPNVSNLELEKSCPALKKRYGPIWNSAKGKLTKYIFHNPDLYGKEESLRKEGILRKAIKSGLVIEKPASKEYKKDKYYFLNSDILFILSRKGIEISVDRESFLYKHKHRVVIDARSRPYKTENINERISLRRNMNRENVEIKEDEKVIPLTLDSLLSSFWWMFKYQSLMSETIDKFWEIHIGDGLFRRRDLPSSWPSRLISKALKDNIFKERGHEIHLEPTIDLLTEGKVFLSFARSYEILRCFNNFEDHLKEIWNNSPMEMLEILTSENYEIKPSKRPLIFSSIIFNRKMRPELTPIMYRELREKIMEAVQIIRNSRLLDSALRGPIGEGCPELMRPGLFDDHLCYDVGYYH